MGMCASQARLLMLTARKNDLQFRMMQITNAKQMLAMQTEEIATKHANALANREYSAQIDGKQVAITGANFHKAVHTSTGLGYEFNEAALAARYGLDTNNKQTVTNNDGSTTDMLNISQLTSTQIYEAIDLGLITLYDENGEVHAPSEVGLMDQNYDEDDGLAAAEYEREMAKIKRKETALDLEAEQIETQQNAVTTEIESVQNLVKKESERTFKYFS